MDLLAGEHRGKRIVIFSLDLREESPVGMPEEINEAHAGSGARLADGLGSPMFFELYEEEIVAQLGLGDGGGVAAEVLVDEPELAVVRVPGSIGVIMQSQQISKLSHRWIGMFIINRIGIVASSGPNGGRSDGLRSALAQLRLRGNLRSAVRLMVEIAGE